MSNTKITALLLTAALALAGCSSMGGSRASAGGEAPKRSAGEVLDDSVITTKVKSALVADPDISALKINVDTAQGRVTLKGEVKSLALRRKAESIAKGVDGVKSVDNQLIITG